MNKKLLLAGFIAAGFITLTAFAAKTLAEQKAEIDAAVQAKLTELRTMKEQECDERVLTESQRRFDEAMAAKAAEEAAKPGGKKPGKKGTKGPKVDPLPQGSTPKPGPQTEEEKAKSRASGAGAKVEEDKAKSRTSGEKAVDEEKKAKSRASGGKPSGGK